MRPGARTALRVSVRPAAVRAPLRRAAFALLAFALWAACLALPAPALAAGVHASPPVAAEPGHGHGHGTDGHEPGGEPLHDGGSANGPAGDHDAAGRMTLRGLAASFGLEEGLLVAFFVFFLLLAGAVLWWILSRGWTESVKRHVGRHILQLQRLTFLSVLANLLLMFGRRGGFDDPSVVLSLADEREGMAWLALLLLSAVGLFLLQRSKLFDTLWLLSAIAAASAIGHADQSLNMMLSALFSAIHLAAAALWIGGLYVLLALRGRHRRDAERLTPNAMNASVAAMVLLFVSGLVNSAMYLPDLGLISQTRWGLILAGKTILFALLVVMAAVFRRRRSGAGFVRLQLLLVLVMAAASGVMPISPPVPDEGPLHWHEMGDDLHMTAEIEPLAVGENAYRVTVWLPAGSGPPRSVELKLVPDGKADAARTVSLERVEKAADQAFPGFDDYRYEASGPHIDRPGRWTVVVRITDAAGQAREYARTAAVY